MSGRFASVEDIAAFPIRVGDRSFRLDDVARVWRGFSDPPAPKMRFMGEEALGLAVSMREGGDILKLGKALDAKLAQLQQTLPVGMELRKVSDQPEAVRESVGEFVRVLAEAVTIVLLVSFFSLGFRTGLVVAISIPLVLAMTFAVMYWLGIGLHKISLGALVLALGLLVDDAIIAVEMMAIKMEQGFDRLRAASFAWESTAFPMLTGTLITAAGFLPIATAASSTGEYTRSLFQVVTIALLVSWVAAVLFIPWLGDRILPDLAHPQPPKPGSFAARRRAWRERLADRWPQFAAICGLGPGDPVGVEALGRLLAHREGMFKNAPARAGRHWLVNSPVAIAPAVASILAALAAEHAELDGLWVGDMRQASPFSHAWVRGQGQQRVRR